MSIRLKIFTEVISAINHRFDINYKRIDVKTIKRLNNIENPDRSKTSLYNFALKELVKQGFIIKEKKTYYRILKRVDKIQINTKQDDKNDLTKDPKERVKSLYEIEEIKKPLDFNICHFCENIINSRKKVYHINASRGTKLPFCNNECKKSWIYKIQKERNKKTRLK